MNVNYMYRSISIIYNSLVESHLWLIPTVSVDSKWHFKVFIFHSVFPVVLEHQHSSEVPGSSLVALTARPCLEFWIRLVWARQKNLHFWRVPSLCWCCWCGGNICLCSCKDSVKKNVSLFDIKISSICWFSQALKSEYI